jgi:small-conductance mechanosensitive channel
LVLQAKQLTSFCIITINFCSYLFTILMSFLSKLPPDLQSLFTHMPGIIWNLAVIVVSVIIGLAIKFIIGLVIRSFADKEAGYSFLLSLKKHLGPVVTYFFPLFVLNIALPLMRMDKLYFTPIDRTVDIALTISFASLLIRAIRVFEDYVYHTYDLNKIDNLKERKIRTQIQFIRKLLVLVIIFVTIAIILLSFSGLRKIGTGLLTGVGIGSIFIGLAAQTSLGNLLAGFQIAFTQPIRIDDVLVVEGEWGRVEDITLTYVVLRIWDQRRLILPINYFIQKPFQNWTRISADILGTVFLYMDYSLPLEPIRAEFMRLLTTSPLWDGKVNVVQVTDAKEKTMEVRFLMSSKNSSEAFDLRCYIREHLITFIQKNYPDSLPKFRTDAQDNSQQAIQASAI